ncbi:MAG: aspartate aminotransferase family protein [Candidatus Rifleibacteriota bacterium]
MNNENLDVRAVEQEHHLQIYKRFDLTIVKGEGTHLYDDKGNEYIDALAGIAVCGLGHCHPVVTDAIIEQAKTLVHVSNLFFTIPQTKLARLLVQSSGLDRAFFCNSGAEAVEGAIKMARKYGAQKGKTGPIYSMGNCFHGRTLATITMGKKKYQQGFDPLPEGFEQIPFNDITALEKAVNKDTVALIIEPLQGEGGIFCAGHDYIKRARQLCDEHDVVLIFDEIQCGLGRTGTLFAYEQYGVKPDIVTLAKALGNGFPIGSFIASDKVAESLSPGDHGTTFGGNPLACAAAFATLSTIIEEKLPQAAKEKGKHFIERLEKLAEEFPSVKEVRGNGLMVGVEVTHKAADVLTIMRDKKVIAGVAGANVVRFLPPLVMTIEELDKVVDTLAQSLKELEK